MTGNLRLALRRLSTAPGFALIAIVMLGLGIGMSTAAFSVTSCDLLTPVSFPHGDRLVRIFRTTTQSQTERHSPANFIYLRSENTSFSGIAVYYRRSVNVSEAGRAPEVKSGLTVTAQFLEVLGIRPLVGRGLAPDEDQPGKGAVAFLTERFWRRSFAGDPNVIGRTIRVGTDPLTVVGVLPDFDAASGFYRTDFVQPETLWPNFPTIRNGRWYQLVARLKAGVSLPSAQAELSTLAARIDHDYPAENSTDGLRATPLAASDIDFNVRVLYWLTVGLASLVLFIACANLASLQLARALGRKHELGVRMALGASRYDLMAPLLFESIELTLAGALVGVALGCWINHLVSHYLWADWPIHLDGRVILFAIAVSLATALIFGLAPAWLASATGAGEALKQVSRGSTSGREQHRIRHFLVVCQLASALILVSAALSFGSAVRQSLRENLGWQPAGLYSGFVSLDPKKTQVPDELRARLAQIPGVSKVSITGAFPIGSYFHEDRIVVEGFPPEPAGQEQPVDDVSVDSEYFRILGIRLKAGRPIPVGLKAADPRVIVINETMARMYWPDSDPIGKRVRFSSETEWNEVIGVVNDVRMPRPGFNRPYSRIQIYRALVQAPESHHSFILKSALPPESLAMSVRKAVAAVDPDLMVEDADSAEGVRRGLVSGYNMFIISLGAFGLVGILIALIGQYAVITQLSLQRFREIGIRIALGADYPAILRLMLSQGAKLILIGVTLGLLGAYGVSRVLQHVMPELDLPGPGLEAGVTVLFCLAGLLASYLPAHRAGRTDPVVALRAD